VQADCLVTGRVATLAGPEGPAWVDAIAIAGGRVIAGGSLHDVESVATARTRRIVLAADEVALPGITDAHLHLAEAALAARRLDLSGEPSLETGLAAIARTHGATPDPASWLEGHGWDADRWGGWPTAEDLARVAPGRRIALWAHDHHALWVSQAVLDDARIHLDSPDPDGGVIRRDHDGNPTGVLHETAARLVTSRVPQPTVDETAAAVRVHVGKLLALGVVGVHDPGGLSLQSGLGTAIEAYRSLAAAGRLGMRVHACIRPEQLDAALELGIRSGAPLGPDPLDRLRAGWLKAFADGTLGSRTAALLEPLEVIPGEPLPPNDGFGVWMTPPAVLADLASRAASGGIATQIHAIGDAAVRAALDALAPTAGATALMPRVEHAQLIADEDVPRFAALGVAASVQPIHVRSDAAKARHLWGPRGEARGYPFGVLAASGAVLPFGTDAPVEPPDPWPGIACAVTRVAPTWPAGMAPFGRHQAMDLWRAVRAACVDPATSAGQHDRGRLVPGATADLIVVPAAAVDERVEVGGALWSARPRLVLLDGVVAYEA
jgi:predicted amidohydrolase YtcJ